MYSSLAYSIFVVYLRLKDYLCPQPRKFALDLLFLTCATFICPRSLLEFSLEPLDWEGS